MRSQQRGDYTATAAYPGTYGQQASGVEQRPSGPFRPHNTDWHPAMSTMQATNRSYVGGYLPGRATHATQHAMNLANMLQSRQWGTTHLFHADQLDRIRHMKMVGMQDEDIQEWGDDVWNTATWHLRNRQHHGIKGAEPIGFGLGPRDREKFDNEYTD